MNMASRAPFSGLFVFEMANNHQGSVAHGRAIIERLHEVSDEFPFRFAVKLQYRDLDSFIHPAYRGRRDIPYVKRFLDTELREPQLRSLKEAIDEAGFTAVCTPFDEPSVDWIEEHGFDILKIASCSLTDWPLLERVAQSTLPVIASTAGTSLDEIDRVVTFFLHRDRPLALMHCVAEYPTPRERLELGQIALLRRRYPELPIGYSTHEAPGETEAVKMAIGLGAELFEKHVGIGELNGYSANPEQVRAWLESAREAYAMQGSRTVRVAISEEEIATLDSLRRGVFARTDLRMGETLTTEHATLAIPSQPGQLLANDLSKYAAYRLEAPLAAGAPILHAGLRRTEFRDQVLEIVKRVTVLLRDSRVTVPDGAPCELSHHYGIDRYAEYGATIIGVVNREYCKKVIVLLPGQRHPVHTHHRKEETFHVLHGVLELELGGVRRQVREGEMVTVERGVAHSFFTRDGVIFEELSTTHEPHDSFYDDPAIEQNHARKTPLVFRAKWLHEELR